MPSWVLPASTEAAATASPIREPEVPKDWPGTFCPNFSDWRVGDVVLVHAPAGWVGSALQRAQAASFKPLIRENAHVTHAALYLGEGMVLDATDRQPVAMRSVWGYCQFREIQVRRLSHPQLSSFARTGFWAAGMLHEGQPYSRMAVILSKLIPGTTPDPDALYCSTLVGLVITQATGVLLEGYPGCVPLYPSTLAGHPALTSLELEWRSL